MNVLDADSIYRRFFPEIFTVGHSFSPYLLGWRYGFSYAYHKQRNTTPTHP